jgi:SPP1 family predicted phage head-tail adaptor
MKATGRNRRIQFQRSISTKDDYGQPVDSWATLCHAYASVNFGTGQERREAAQESGSAPATFSVLSNSDTNAVTVKDRIIFDGSAWDITSNVPSREFNAGRDITAIRLQPTGD